MMKRKDYTKVRRNADRSIVRAGTSGVLRVPGPTTGDPWEPVEGAGTDYPVSVVVTEYADRDVDGTLIQQTDKKALISAEGLTIEIDQASELVIAGDVYNIIAIEKIKPADVVVLYEAQIRK